MNDFASYVFYVNRPDLLDRAVNSFPDLHKSLTIIDNSKHAMMSLPGKIYTPSVPLTYSQSMNWMLADALSRDVSFIIHFHSDAFSSNPSAVRQLLEYARKVKSEGTKWACLWTFYDILWAINPAALEDIGGCDTQLTDYFTDQDLKRRWRLAGWETIDTMISGVHHNSDIGDTTNLDKGSSVINSDPELKFLNSRTFPLRRQYYIWKWGGDPGHEVFHTPFNR